MPFALCFLVCGYAGKSQEEKHDFHDSRVCGACGLRGRCFFGFDRTFIQIPRLFILFQKVDLVLDFSIEV